MFALRGAKIHRRLAPDPIPIAYRLHSQLNGLDELVLIKLTVYLSSNGKPKSFQTLLNLMPQGNERILVTPTNKQILRSTLL